MDPATNGLPRTSRNARRLHAAAYLTTLALLGTGWWLWAGGEGNPSPLARLTGVADARIHVWVGRGLVVVVVLPLLRWWRAVVAFVRETIRVDRGDARWWRRWPVGALTGQFGRHEGHFDPGQRVANVLIVGGLLTLVVTGLGMTLLHGGEVFAWMAKLHRWTTYAITPVLLGHIVVAVGVLPGYRGVWRAMHGSGRVREDTARRVWPGWAERAAPASDRPTPSREEFGEAAASARSGRG
jgi:formate dehydrogenase subunit gamma